MEKLLAIVSFILGVTITVVLYYIGYSLFVKISYDYIIYNMFQTIVIGESVTIIDKLPVVSAFKLGGLMLVLKVPSMLVTSTKVIAKIITIGN